MVIFNVGEEKRHDLRAHFEVAERVAREISATFKAPNDLEYEKARRLHVVEAWLCPGRLTLRVSSVQAYFPYLLFSKKRYAGARRNNFLGR